MVFSRMMLEGLLAVIQNLLDQLRAGVASEAQSLPVVKINLNDNYCLGVPAAPNSGKELSVNNVYSQDFVLAAPNVNFVANNSLRPPQKTGVSPPVNLRNKRCKSCSQSQLFSVCNSYFCYDKCCTKANCSETLVPTLSKAGFKSIIKSSAAHGSG